MICEPLRGVVAHARLPSSFGFVNAFAGLRAPGRLGGSLCLPVAGKPARAVDGPAASDEITNAQSSGAATIQHLSSPETRRCFHADYGKDDSDAAAFMLCRTGQDILLFGTSPLMHDWAKGEVETMLAARPQKITFGEMREMGVRGILMYCADHHCNHSVAISADRWADDVRLSDIKPRFVCRACGRRGEEMTKAGGGLLTIR